MDAVFDLVGNSVLRDSMQIVRTRGRVCQLGFLGGLEPVAGFNPVTDLPTGVQFSFYGSAFVLGTDEFPLADIPLQEMITKAETRRYTAKPARVFGFNEIVKAHVAMEEGLVSRPHGGPPAASRDFLALLPRSASGSWACPTGS